MTTHAHTKKSDSEAGASSTDATGALELLDKVIAALALPTQSLTVKQRKAATRSRKGMEKVIGTLATLSTEHGVTVPKQSTSQMTSNLALVTQLDPVKQKLVSALTLVQDNMDNAGSASWNTAGTLYGMLQKVAHRDSQLRSQLAPVKEFFAYRTPGAKKASKKKKEALANEQAAAAQATAVVPVTAAPTDPSAATPSAASVSASTPASPVLAASNVVAPHTP